MQDLASDGIRKIVRSRNYRNFDEIAKTALVEESANTSKQDRYRTEGAPYLGVALVGIWVTRATNAVLGRKERHG